jgi:hypothetical protein
MSNKLIYIIGIPFVIAVLIAAWIDVKDNPLMCLVMVVVTVGTIVGVLSDLRGDAKQGKENQE